MKTMKERMLTGDLYIPSHTEGLRDLSIKGKKLAFYTNTKGNVYFYTKNGYKEVYSSEISFNQVEMGSWYFLKELKKH